MDETGWREAGQNGYVWVMTNAAGTSYYHYDHSRSGAVARSLSGAHYAGTLCTDFYAGYNEHQCRHQRCWAHLVRDLAELEKAHGTDEAIAEWIKDMCDLYKDGAEVGGRAPPPSGEERAAKAAELQGRAHALGLRWAQAQEHPTHALCQRLLRHEAELFEFVRQAEVEATNNRAERAIRPLAVARKISGGHAQPQWQHDAHALTNTLHHLGRQGARPVASLPGDAGSPNSPALIVNSYDKGLCCKN